MSDVGEMVFLPALAKHLDESGAAVKVQTAQLPAEEIAAQLESGEIDFAAGYLPALNKGLDNARLFREHYVCMMRRSHPLAREGALTLRNFLAASHVLIESMGSGHRIIERTLERRGLRRDVALRVPHFLAVPMIVANTDRIVTVPSRVANAFVSLANVRVCALPVKIPSFDITLSWHPRFAEDPGIRWMRAVMIELFQEPAAGSATRGRRRRLPA
jgi:DNA-binding transcriptional LysR family regulator